MILGISDHMDYAGQKLAERVLQFLIVLFGAAGWLYGYYIQDFFMTVKILALGFALAFVMVMPPWPCLYRRNPLKWVQPPSTEKKKK